MWVIESPSGRGIGDIGIIIPIGLRSHKGAGNAFCHALSSSAWRFLDEDFGTDLTLVEGNGGVGSCPVSVPGPTLRDLRSLYERERARADRERARADAGEAARRRATLGGSGLA